MKDTKLSKLPYKGTSDIYPNEMYVRNYLFNIWRKVAERFGYEEYDTPYLEETALTRQNLEKKLQTTNYTHLLIKGKRNIP